MDGSGSSTEKSSRLLSRLLDHAKTARALRQASEIHGLTRRSSLRGRPVLGTRPPLRRARQFVPRQEVSKKIVDTQDSEVRAWRCECTTCGPVFRVYPKRVSRKGNCQRSCRHPCWFTHLLLILEQSPTTLDVVKSKKTALCLGCSGRQCSSKDADQGRGPIHFEAATPPAPGWRAPVHRWTSMPPPRPSLHPGSPIVPEVHPPQGGNPSSKKHHTLSLLQQPPKEIWHDNR